MVKTFQIILIAMIIIGFLGIIGEKENNNIRNNLARVCIVGIIAFILTLYV